jgi:hypothetical protein
MSPAGLGNKELLSWRGPAAIYLTDQPTFQRDLKVFKAAKMHSADFLGYAIVYAPSGYQITYEHTASICNGNITLNTTTQIIH